MLTPLAGLLWYFELQLVKYPSDSQNASVPLFLAFDVIGSFMSPQAWAIPVIVTVVGSITQCIVNRAINLNDV